MHHPERKQNPQRQGLSIGGGKKTPRTKRTDEKKGELGKKKSPRIISIIASSESGSVQRANMARRKKTASEGSKRMRELNKKKRKRKEDRILRRTGTNRVIECQTEGVK